MGQASVFRGLPSSSTVRRRQTTIVCATPCTGTVQLIGGQYTSRGRNILRKLEEKGERLPDFGAELTPAALGRQLASEDFWQLLLAASKADAAVERAVTAGEPAHVAKYAFQIAQTFNNFYHLYPIIHEQNREKKVLLLWMTDFFRRQLEWTLDILGIQVPDYM